MSEQRVRRSIDQGLFGQGPAHQRLAQSSTMAAGWRAFGRWFGDALAYAMGRPADMAAAAPPLLGVQPYHGVIESRRGRHRH
jgi:hypothetical protein